MVGDDSWRQAAYRTEQGLFGPMEEKEAGNETVVEAYCKRLKEVAGFKYVPKPLPMCNTSGAVVYYGRRFALAEKRERIFQERAAFPASARLEVGLEVVVVRGDFVHCADRGGAKRRATKIRMENDAGAIDERLEARSRQVARRCSDRGDDLVEFRRSSFRAKTSEMLPNELGNARSRQINVAQPLE